MWQNPWFIQLHEATKSAMKQGNLKKVHYHLKNGQEMVEEYNTDTKCLTRRAWKIKNEVGEETGWNIEIGDPEPTALKSNAEFICENSTQPFISRRITRNCFEWRIRNLPYKLDIYSITAEDNELVIRTSNKKYFKKIHIPELQRINLKPAQASISFTHQFNTLIVTYEKPKEYKELEELIYKEIVEKTEPKDFSLPSVDGCKTS